MKRSLPETAAFSMVEITLAMGVAAFCLIAVMGMLPAGLKIQQASIQQTTANEILSDAVADLRASVRYPPGQANKLNSQQQTLKGHWATAGTPDTLYYTNEGSQTGGLSPSTVPADAVFRLTLTYLLPPTDTTSLANITVTWPAQVDPSICVPAASAATYTLSLHDVLLAGA